MIRPCVMDIKVGNISYNEVWESFYSHSPDVVEKTKGKYVVEKTKNKFVGTMGPFGFAVISIVVNSEEGEKRLDKEFGKSLSTETIHTVLENYLDEKNAQKLAKYFVQKLMEIEVFFEKQTSFHVFGSSLLFIYDQGSSVVNSAQVRLIDFENQFPADGKFDENYLFGLRNVRKLFEAFTEKNN